VSARILLLATFAVETVECGGALARNAEERGASHAAILLGAKALAIGLATVRVVGLVMGVVFHSIGLVFAVVNAAWLLGYK
jgi:hypothetical protein